MVNIAVHCEFLQPGKVGGAEHMLRSIITGLLHYNGIKLHVFSQNEEFTKELDSDIIIHQGIGFYKNRFIQETLNELFYNNLYDVVIHPNYFCPPLRSKKKKRICIIHDALYRHIPHMFSLRKRLWLKVTHKIALKYSDEIVTISKFVKNDLLRIYGSKWQKKMNVIYNPIDWERFEKVYSSNYIKYPFILSVAAHYPHKNIESLIKAFEIVLCQWPNLKLVLVGQIGNNLIGKNKKSNISDLIKQKSLMDKVIITGYINDAQLGFYYKNAELFVFPSLFEGFGLPPVEALGMGLPVLSSDVGPLKEVTLGMARYMENPLDINLMAKEIIEIMKNRKRAIPTYNQIRKIRHIYDPISICEKYLELIMK